MGASDAPVGVTCVSSIPRAPSPAFGRRRGASVPAGRGEDGHGLDRRVAAPLQLGGGRVAGEVDRPSAVVLLPAARRRSSAATTPGREERAGGAVRVAARSRADASTSSSSPPSTCTTPVRRDVLAQPASGRLGVAGGVRAAAARRPVRSRALRLPRGWRRGSSGWRGRATGARRPPCRAAATRCAIGRDHRGDLQRGRMRVGARPERRAARRVRDGQRERQPAVRQRHRRQPVAERGGLRRGDRRRAPRTPRRRAARAPGWLVLDRRSGSSPQP